MRCRYAMLALAGCGRLGFDAGAGPPTDEPSLCDQVEAGTVELEGTPRSLRIVELPDELAILVGTSVDNVYAVRVDRTTLRIVSTHLPLAAEYLLQGGGAIGKNVFVLADSNDVAFLKALDPTWDSYDTPQSGSAGSPVDPPFAVMPNGTTAMFGAILAGTLGVFEIDSTGTATGLNTNMTATAGSASLARIPTGARVVLSDLTDCRSFVIDPDGTLRDEVKVAGCVRPLVLGLADGTGVIVHGAPATPAIVATTVSGATASAPLAIANGSLARASIADGELWIGFTSAGTFRLARVDAAGAVEIRELPTIVGPFDLAPALVAWLDGQTLRLARPCFEP